MTTVNLTNPSINVVSNQNFTASGSGSSYTVDSDSNNNSVAIQISVTSGPVNVSPTSRTIGQSFTITPQASTGNYVVSLSQSVTTGGGKNSTTTNYRARVEGNVAAAPTPSYSLGSVSNMNEGATQNVSVTTANVSNGTTLYWTIDGAGDFTAHSGSFTISNNSGSFSITAIDDSTTEGNETKYLRLRTGSTSGSIQDTETFVVVDTSTSGSGGGSGGSGTGGSSSGSNTYGIEITGPNGSTVIFGNNLRTQSILTFATTSMANNTTYTYTGVPNANSSSKVQIIVDFGYSNEARNGSNVHIVRYSNYFTVRHTLGGTKTAKVIAIRIA